MPPPPSDVPEYPSVKRTRAVEEHSEETWKRIRKDVNEQVQEDLEDATELFKMHASDQIGSVWANRDEYKKHRDRMILDLAGILRERREQVLKELAQKKEVKAE